MMKLTVFGSLLVGFLALAGCQSQRAFLFRPVSTTRTSIAATAHEPLQPVPAAPAVVPELIAELPASAASYNAVRPARAIMSPPPRAAATALVLEPTVSATPQLAPDTALVRPATAVPLQKIKETDLFTKLVRVVGVLLVLAAVALFITAFTTTSTGWTALAFLFYGVVTVLISIPFFLFRGKDSPRRQELERRRAARKAAASR